jgi:23S rRNA (cytosine1962-C5)-methyltransferase
MTPGELVYSGLWLDFFSKAGKIRVKAKYRHRVIRVSKAAARAARSGHPWVFREGFEVKRPGEVVIVEGSDGVLVGWGLTDKGPIAIRMMGRKIPGTIDINRTLAERVRRADAWRLRNFDADTTAYRLVAGAGDALPGLVVDRYGGVAVLRVYSDAWGPYLEGLVSAVKGLPWVESVFRRYGVERVDGRTGGETLYGPEVPEHLTVLEHGMKLLVRPRSGQKTGLFLDQRTHRRLIRDWSAGRLVVNLFAYNGGFSVAAALGGAATVATVDIAPDAVEDARENFRLNGLDPADYQFEVADVFEWRPKSKVDLLILDPPSMARNRKALDAAKHAYTKLHAAFASCVAHDGLFATASCTARMSREEWEDAIRVGLSRGGEWAWHWKSSEPLDHPNGLMHREAEYLKFALLRKL